MPRNNGSGRCIEKAQCRGSGKPRVDSHVSRDEAQRHLDQLVRYGGYTLSSPVDQVNGQAYITAGKDGFSWVFTGPRAVIVKLYDELVEQLPEHVKPQGSQLISA